MERKESSDRKEEPTGSALRRGSEGPTGELPTPEAVAGFLRANPDFLAGRPDLMAIVTPPALRQGDTVVDMQRFMLERLRAELERVTALQNELIALSRSNMASQSRVHAAVLAIIGAQSFEQLIQTVTTDIAALVDIDVASLCIETAILPERQPGMGVFTLEKGGVASLLGSSRDVVLLDDIEGDPTVFGDGAGLVRSAAYLRLDVGATAPAGLLAMGSRRLGKFHPGQGTELLTFLAGTLALTIGAWLDLD